MSKLEEYVKAHGGSRVLKKILVANNGMAATKAIMSMRQWAFLELGSPTELQFIAMASKDDLEANAEFIRLADSYVEVPPGKNVNNYANVPLIVEIARAQCVDCVWPGWGHASENPELPRALAAAGIIFLGPTAPVMHALGDKIASTILAQSSNVPCIPWNGEGITADIQSDGSIPQEPFKRACLKNHEEALVCANRIGYPVVLKASEGGGGKGIRKCANDEDIKLGWEQVATEVPGSPVFMMQLCTGARHLEVQLVGDEHGSVVALIGRDCSTQRRFQKIFEEGPPTIADRDDFRKAEKAAQRLAMSVGYRGAGTVEYLYKPENKGFYFLELNPRLQVEHPVTEGITGVNVPALQLQIGMGIPLHRVPDIRRFYGRDVNDSESIDFLEDEYIYPKTHVIAARVTAENPDDAFRPTSGKIERVRFQSSPSAWGYFSIGANGGIHEFADSQFGHIFASGPTREHARKSLQLALKNISIVGEIRNPTEYLVELAETEDFKNNTIDTAWLDKLIAEKSVKMNFRVQDMIFYGACLRVHLVLKTLTEQILDGMKRGHMPLANSMKMLQSCQVEIAYDNIKYNWHVLRTGVDTFAMTIAETTLAVRLREQPDGSLYVRCEEKVAQITGVEEPLGLRLRVENQATITFPKIQDPSELRSDFNGKLVRYLHADGADIKEGEPFAELEAMKMIMSLRSKEAGKISHTLASGAIVGAGDLLGTLVLTDPSKVQLVKPFSGQFKLGTQEDFQQLQRTPSEAHAKDVCEELRSCLDGFIHSPELSTPGIGGAVHQVFGMAEHASENALSTTCTLLRHFLDNEGYFAGLVGGDETQTIQKFQGTPDELLSKLLAHSMLKDSSEIISSLLRALIDLPAFEPTAIPEEGKQCLEELANFPDTGGYGQVKLHATQLLHRINRPLKTGKAELRSTLASTSRRDLANIATAFDTDRRTYFSLDAIAQFFSDEDSSIRSKALEMYILRSHRGYEIQDIEVVDAKEVIDKTPAAVLHTIWGWAHPGAHGASLKGYAIIVPSVESFKSLKASWSMPNLPEISELHILVGKAPGNQKSIQEMQHLLEETGNLVTALKSTLDAKKAVAVNVVLAHSAGDPTFLHYTKNNGWTEKAAYRNMRARVPDLIEHPLIESDFTLTPLQHGKIFALDFGVSLDKKTEVVFARGASHIERGTDTFEATLMDDLVTSMDYVERNALNPVLAKRLPATQIFMHLIPPIAGTTERDAKYLQILFGSAIQKCVALYGSRVLYLRLSKIEVKVWMATTPPTALRLVATSARGWEAEAFFETIDSISGLPVAWQNIETQKTLNLQDMLKPPVEAFRGSKRQMARAAGSTYIYDFPALFRISLTKIWMKSESKEQTPQKLVTATELVLEDGEFVEREQLGKNTVGMVVWLLTLRTPEYPNGRDVILVGNDITIKGGSFGVDEDQVFYKASELARHKGIPRLYIACNSGARIGGIDELKSVLQIAWSDKNDLMKGFDYLYLKDDVMKTLPPNSVESHTDIVNGETRHVLDAIVGLNFPSAKGGIGVECLQGSGLIVGETSRAYMETFTLSYATGRSVGVGAYLNRLGQRNIQMVHGPMILTGPEPLNKLMGQQIYTSQDQLGGPHIMVPNGVTHELVQNDQDGVEAILRWLSFVPETVHSLPPIVSCSDSVNRKVAFKPTKAAYDPRHMLAGVKMEGEWQSGFCDEGSFHEYMSGWGKTVVVGRGRLGGMPIGIISVETRSCEKHTPADPQEPTSREVIEMQAGQVWYPDSAYKTAQSIRDFGHGEGLPLLILANWRGFSGGTRDMFAEVLKYGSMIVDALVEYRQPVTIYIPPNGELRGGAWVVLDPKINEDCMEMYADRESRGGILEPPGQAEVVFKKEKQVIDMMRRLDEPYKKLLARKEAGEEVDHEIKRREKLLLPLYQQVACEYCDLHDRFPRMEALGVIRDSIEWADSRKYLHWRIRRRVQENHVVRRLQRNINDMTHKKALAVVADMCQPCLQGVPKDRQDEVAALWIENHSCLVDARVELERQRATEDEIYRLVATLPKPRQSDVVRDLVGYTRVASQTENGVVAGRR